MAHLLVASAGGGLGGLARSGAGVGSSVGPARQAGRRGLSVAARRPAVGGLVGVGRLGGGRRRVRLRRLVVGSSARRGRPAGRSVPAGVVGRGLRRVGRGRRHVAACRRRRGLDGLGQLRRAVGMSPSSICDSAYSSPRSTSSSHSLTLSTNSCGVSTRMLFATAQRSDLLSRDFASGEPTHAASSGNRCLTMRAAAAGSALVSARMRSCTSNAHAITCGRAIAGAQHGFADRARAGVRVLGDHPVARRVEREQDRLAIESLGEPRRLEPLPRTRCTRGTADRGSRSPASSPPRCSGTITPYVSSGCRSSPHVPMKRPWSGADREVERRSAPRRTPRRRRTSRARKPSSRRAAVRRPATSSAEPPPCFDVADGLRACVARSADRAPPQHDRADQAQRARDVDADAQLARRAELASAR